MAINVRQQVQITQQGFLPDLEAVLPLAQDILPTDYVLLWQTPNPPDPLRPYPYLSLATVADVQGLNKFLCPDNGKYYSIVPRLGNDGKTIGIQWIPWVAP